MFDTHVHTEFSVDSDMLLRDGIQSAQEKNIGITITDHMDIHDYKKDTFIFDVDAFFKAYEPYRSDKVLLGIEMGLRKEAVARNKEIVQNYDFDFVLGSTHCPYATKTHLEYYDEQWYEGVSKEEAYKEYLASMLEGVKENPYFDSLAHIDYISRYSPYDDKELYYDEFSAGIDKVLQEVARQGKSMEISTRRLQNPQTKDEFIKIYSRFKALGGETVTIGSDSHGAAAIGHGFEEGMEIAKRCGLKPVYYKKRLKVYL